MLSASQSSWTNINNWPSRVAQTNAEPFNRVVLERRTTLPKTIRLEPKAAPAAALPKAVKLEPKAAPAAALPKTIRLEPKAAPAAAPPKAVKLDPKAAPAANISPAQAYSVRVKSEITRREKSGETRLCGDRTVSIVVEHLRLEGLDDSAIRRVLITQIRAILPVDPSDSSDRARDILQSEGVAGPYFKGDAAL